MLTLIVGPSQESLEVGETKKDLAERYTLRQQYLHVLYANDR